MLDRKVGLIFLILISSSLQAQDEQILPKDREVIMREVEWAFMTLICVLSTSATATVVKYIHDKPIVDISYIINMYRDSFVLVNVSVYLNVAMALTVDFQGSETTIQVIFDIKQMIGFFNLMSWLLASTMKFLTKYNLKSREAIDEWLGNDEESLTKIRRILTLMAILTWGLVVPVLKKKRNLADLALIILNLIMLIMTKIMTKTQEKKPKMSKEEKVLKATVFSLVLISGLSYSLFREFRLADIDHLRKIHPYYLDFHIGIVLGGIFPILTLVLNRNIASWTLKKCGLKSSNSIASKESAY